MFSIGFKRLYYVCDKVVVRNLRNRSRPPPNPGLQNRISAFRNEGLKIDDEDAEEFVEQSASDLFNAGDVYNEHLNETLIGKYELRHQIVKEKYFKDNMPNLLTWSEKEQIRHLATTNPNEWTPERIAESFPVTAAAAKKLLKFVWKPASDTRIARHDASAMRNWRELREGSLDIPEDLRQHFLKFSDRTIPPLRKQSFKIDITQERDIGEFEQIVRRCAAKDGSTQDIQDRIKEDDNVETEAQDNTVKKKKDTKRITLDELAMKIQHRLDKGSEIEVTDKMMLDMVTAKPVTPNTAEIKNELDVFPEDIQTGIIKSKSIENNVMNIDYTKRIRIPKKAYKRGATYKVNDCYYDDDGVFLYRVLGMSK